nr:hypothetical protein TDPV-232 [Oriental turtle dovepox virus]
MIQVFILRNLTALIKDNPFFHTYRFIIHLINYNITLIVYLNFLNVRMWYNLLKQS